VTYGVPWTYDLKPRWVLKELFVSEGVRSSGIGNKLFEAVTAAAAERGATRIDWTVLPQNERAKAFYRARGGKPDAAWENWTLALSSGAVVGQ
jgi:ribosomal protein S18 acetylase RimI-like enzyme